MPTPSAIIRATAALALLQMIACAHRVEPRPSPLPVTVSEIVLADSADIRRVTGHAPRYPTEMQAQSIEARLIAFVIIDTTGRVDPRTVRFDSNAPLPFRVEVCRELAESRYTPLRRDGRLRPALVVSPFTFEMAGSRNPSAAVRTDAKSVRAAILQLGIPAALEQMASAPGCPYADES